MPKAAAVFRYLACLAFMGVALGASPNTAGAQIQAGPDGIPDISIARSFPHHGDASGTRRWLADHGVVYTLIYTNDVLTNLAGGEKRGTIDQGKLDAAVSIDFKKLTGWDGLTFYANMFQIHNTGRMRRDYVGGITTIAAIEAVPSTRLSEIWFEQKFGKANVRVGQLAADVEFFFSAVAAVFLQSDWPTITGSNLPGGGPAYPLSTPGIRVKWEPSTDMSFLVAVFNGDPAGPGPGDEQVRNPHGLNFRLKDPAFIMGEAQFRHTVASPNGDLAGTVKVGGWTHLGLFNDQRYANDGKLLADPTSSGVPAKRRGDLGVYGVFDQQIYRPAGGSAETGVFLFARGSTSPSDRNLLNAFIDGGIVFAGMVPGRPNDVFGASALWARYSDGVRAYDSDVVRFTGIPKWPRDYEASMEVTYRAQVISGWTVQPMASRIWHPSGQRGRDATVIGVRSVWTY